MHVVCGGVECGPAILRSCYGFAEGHLLFLQRVDDQCLLASSALYNVKLDFSMTIKHLRQHQWH